MIKYHFRVYDPETDHLMISCIIPEEELFSFIKEYSPLGVVKAYILDSESEDK